MHTFIIDEFISSVATEFQVDESEVELLKFNEDGCKMVYSIFIKEVIYLNNQIVKNILKVTQNERIESLEIIDSKYLKIQKRITK